MVIDELPWKDLATLIHEINEAKSKTEARRMIASGSIKFNDTFRVTDPFAKFIFSKKEGMFIMQKLSDEIKIDFIPLVG